LCLGVDKVIARGMQGIIGQIRDRMASLEDPEGSAERALLEAAILSLQAAIDYSERFADRAVTLAAETDDPQERARLDAIARHCRHVPCNPPRTFHEALQSAYFTLLVGEIQYGTQDVFAVGRADQYLFDFYQRDLAAGRLTEERAMALLQEFYLKQTANVEPIPEAGMESNAVLGNSQHVVTIGGLTPEGDDATNALTLLMIDAYEQMNGCANQLSVRLSEHSPAALWDRTTRVFRTTSGIAFFNDEAIVSALEADGMRVEDARDYCIVGCVETSGQSDTHGCPGGHELVLPAVLLLTLSRGRRPPRAPGQMRGFDSGDPATFHTYPALLDAFRRQLAHQVDVMVRATAGKDRAHRELLPAPYVSALMDGCIERARDITDGGARYDFTSLDVRGLATVVDSLLALRTFVYQRRELSLAEIVHLLDRDFSGDEVLRQRMIREAPKYGTRHPDADALARDVVHWIHQILAPRRNVRGGRWRACYYSYGNHVIDGMMLGATPDGRHHGEPISNGVSPNNFVELPAGPLGPMAAVAGLPANEVSSGLSLNLRFHPDFLRTEEALRSFTALIQTYFVMGGMHFQPNVVSTETLREAQRHPERHRDLVVKVSGYSAYFTDLGHSIQEDIIARHEFGG
ncbi:MAG: hypothetical protein JRJ84_14675, partial [Deltaproteobacteria bacterium]|nr:hypothetical protein [Deltaproteobacteria bacterium]